MSWIFEQPLPVTEVYSLLLKPRELSKEEFLKLNWLTNGWKNILECSSVAAVAIDAGIATSISDVRRLIKQGSLFVGKRQIKVLNEHLTEKDFLDTGMLGVRWNSIRNGKKISIPIIIVENEDLFPLDPWFGRTYDNWKEERNGKEN